MRTAPVRQRRFDSLEQEAYLGLWRTYDRLRALEDQLFEAHQLTAQQYNALRLLRAEHPGSLPTLVLAARLISRAPDITRLVDRLAARGLVERVRPTDNRRTVRVGITAAGLALLRELGPAVRACHARQLGHLSGRQLGALIDLLGAVRTPHEEPGSPWRPSATGQNP
jgi:DNA-binding MarR family transcriptional regulator